MPTFDADAAPTAEIAPAAEIASADEALAWRRRPPPPPPRHRPAPRPSDVGSHQTTLTVSALSAGGTMLSASGELRLAPGVGATITGALGAGDTFAWDVGADFDGYVLGDFDRGLSLGGLVGASDLGLGVGPGLTFTPRVGGKYTFPVPLTVEAYAGVAIQDTAVALVVAPSFRVGVGLSF